MTTKRKSKFENTELKNPVDDHAFETLNKEITNYIGLHQKIIKLIEHKEWLFRTIYTEKVRLEKRGYEITEVNLPTIFVSNGVEDWELNEVKEDG